MAKLTKTQRAEIHSKFGGHCAYCGEQIEFEAMQVDHVIPQSELMYNRKGEEFKNQSRIPDFLKHLGPFDLNHPDNLFPACRVCNKWKSSYDLEGFRAEITAQPERMKRDSTAYRMASRYSLVKETAEPVIFYFETLQEGYCKHCKGPCQRVDFPDDDYEDEY